MTQESLFSNAGKSSSPFAPLTYYLWGNKAQQENRLTNALQYFLKAAEGEYAPAYLRLGRLYQGDLGIIPKDQVRSDFYYQKASEHFAWFSNEAKENNLLDAKINYYQGKSESPTIDPDAQFNLAECYQHGLGVEKNLSKAIELYELALDQKLAMAGFNLGLLYENDLARISDASELAINYYQLAANYGSCWAQNRLGDYMVAHAKSQREGIGGVDCYRKSAAQEYAPAEYNLAWCYENSRYTKKSASNALKFYKNSAEHGYALAQYRMGLCYEEGEGMSQDLKKAFEWYEKAALQGYAMAQHTVGCYYHSGENGVVEQDFTKAFRWFEKAALQGDSEAQYDLARCYKKGDGVSEDLQKAYEWYEKASQQGHEDATLYLNTFLKQYPHLKNNTSGDPMEITTESVYSSPLHSSTKNTDSSTDSSAPHLDGSDGSMVYSMS